MLIVIDIITHFAHIETYLIVLFFFLSLNILQFNLKFDNVIKINWMAGNLIVWFDQFNLQQTKLNKLNLVIVLLNRIYLKIIDKKLNL